MFFNNRTSNASRCLFGALKRPSVRTPAEPRASKGRLARHYKLTRPRYMQLKIFLEDLNEDAIERIRWVLRYELGEEQGMAPETISDEQVEDYLNRHNAGIPIEL